MCGVLHIEFTNYRKALKMLVKLCTRSSSLEKNAYFCQDLSPNPQSQHPLRLFFHFGKEM